MLERKIGSKQLEYFHLTQNVWKIRLQNTLNKYIELFKKFVFDCLII